jgi:hypothetical protein
LKFEEKPDYKKCKQYFENVLLRVTGSKKPAQYDWLLRSVNDRSADLLGAKPDNVLVDGEEISGHKRKVASWIKTMFCFC